MTCLELNEVSFGYGDRTVIDGISLTFDRPGLVCLLGPNGVGKTTLAKCVSRLLRPKSGSITLDGSDIFSMGQMELARRLTYVPNSESSVFSMSVAEAVLMGRHPHSSWSVSERDLRIVDDVLRTMDLQEMSSCDIREISAGQMQRVMIARGLAQEPEILILDEPTSNLDVRYQMDVMEFLRTYAHEKGIMIIMVCHDLNITSAYADRVILMSGGHIHSDGRPSDVITEDTIRQVYDVDSKVLDIDGVTCVVLVPRRNC